MLAAKLESEAITVEILDEKKSQNETQKQIVRDTNVPDEVKAPESENPADFLSAHTQRVKKQTQAAVSGMTQNRDGQTSPEESKRENRPQQNSSQKSDPRFPGGLEAFTPKYRTAPSLPQEPSQDQGLSTIGEALPNDIAVGSFTALNTDRYLYYSFFARIEEMIRFRWESAVRDAIDSTPTERLSQNVSGIWTTQMEVWLKPNGEVHSTHVMKGAGLKRFDLAATQSFIQARMFPNPPKEMVESDGLIKLKYSFQVRYEPKVLVKSSD
ncbi:MAG: TonB C-terminal domain-containing protein [Pseudobdellovibrionaceae bacterium]